MVFVDATDDPVVFDQFEQVAGSTRSGQWATNGALSPSRSGRSECRRSATRSVVPTGEVDSKMTRSWLRIGCDGFRGGVDVTQIGRMASANGVGTAKIKTSIRSVS